MLANFAASYLLGLATPLTAVCVLPLYPGFIAFLSNQRQEADRRPPLLLGLAVVAGVVACMVAIGLVFSTLLELSLTGVAGIASPIAFTLLAVIGVLLLFDADFSRLFPVVRAPSTSRPVAAAFGYGAFFAFIILPCNPGFIGAFFSKQLALSVGDFGLNVLNSVIFALGIGTPLLVLAVAGAAFGREHHRLPDPLQVTDQPHRGRGHGRHLGLLSDRRVPGAAAPVRRRLAIVALGSVISAPPIQHRVHMEVDGMQAVQEPILATHARFALNRPQTVHSAEKVVQHT